MQKIMIVHLIIGIGAGFTNASNTCHEETWVPNGKVNAIAIANNRVYIGGAFSKVGPYTGCGTPISRRTGSALDSFPKFNGIVYSVCRDGNHGWFVGGQFSAVAGIPRNNIVHLRANGQVDMNWDAGTDDYVQALTLDGQTLYMGGNFTTVGGKTRNRAAAVDAMTGAVKSWDPNVGGWVTAIAVKGPVVYIGGNFGQIHHEDRMQIAAVDTSAGIPTSWNPHSSGWVSSIVVGDSVVFAAGSFSEIGGASRINIAALDISTGQAMDFNPGANFFVNSLVLDTSTLYVAGFFDTICGHRQPYIAVLNSKTGELLDWNPNADGGIYSIALHDSSLYVGGVFGNIGGKARNYAAELNCATASATSWNPDPNKWVRSIAIDDSIAFIGGLFSSLGGVPRNRLASLDATTGAATSWNPDANGEIWTISVQNNKVYGGGAFTLINGKDRKRIACVDAQTGDVSEFLADCNNSVFSLCAKGSRLYAGGSFDTINGQRRSRIAALDTAAGSVLSWNPNAIRGYNCKINAIIATDSIVFAGGAFDSIGGKHQSGLAALSANTGIATSWNPNDSQYITSVNAFALKGGTLYVGGDFYRIGQSPNNIAAVDITTGSALKWKAGAYNPVLSVAVIGTTVFAGQISYNYHEPGQLVAINSSTGLDDIWVPRTPGVVWALASSGNSLYVGGNFESIGGEQRIGFAQFVNYDPVPVTDARRFSVKERTDPMVVGSAIRYFLPIEDRLTIDIFTLQGKRLFHRSVSSGPGKHETLLPLNNLTHGIYIVNITSTVFRFANMIHVVN
jgi:hypothetical protein